MQGIIHRLIANRTTEKELRDYLTEIGYDGASANFLRLELAAVERPGWVQVFVFHIEVQRLNGNWETPFGLCRSDERNGTFEVQLFGDREHQQRSFRSTKFEMVTSDRSPKHWVKTLLMTVFLAAVGIAVLGAAISAATPIEAAPATESQ